MTEKNEDKGAAMLRPYKCLDGFAGRVSEASQMTRRPLGNWRQ